MMRITVRNLAAPAALALLTGCLGLGGKTPKVLFALTADERAPAGQLASGKVGDSIVVLDPDTDRRIDVDRVPVQINPSTVAYLKGAVWVERPARQFRRLLAETVRARADRVVVEGADFEVGGRTMVSGRLSQLGYDAAGKAAIVQYDAVVEEQGKTMRSRRFEARVAGIEAKAEAVGPALNQAANEVAGAAAEWILGG